MKTFFRLIAPGFFAVLCFTSGLFAQITKPDFIHKKDKTIIEAVIVEVGDDDIQYRRFSNPAGQIYRVSKADLIKIVYNNGETENITYEKPAKSASKAKKSKDEDAPKAVSKKQKAKVATDEADEEVVAKKEPKPKTKPVANPRAGMTPENKEEKKALESAELSERSPVRFRIGLRGGVNLASQENMGNSPDQKISSLIGPGGGLILNLGGKTFSVQPEILYNQLGIKGVDVNESRNYAEVTSNVLTIPLLLKLSFGEQVGFFVNAGGYASYGLSGKVKLSDYDESTQEVTVISQSVAYTGSEGRIQYGVVGGAGVSFGLGRAMLLLEGRYYYGLGDNSTVVPGVKKSFVNIIQPSIGIIIPLGN